MDLEKAGDGTNRESLWQALRMYDGLSKLLNGIKVMYANSLAYVRLKGEKVNCSSVVLPY